MDLRVLKYFLMVVKEGNISRAAQILHITQPTLSRQLMNLEKELGTKLFLRGKRAITLTEDGAIFYQRAHEIVELTDKIEEEFSRNGKEIEGTITIGCVETNGSKDLADFITYFHSKYPKVSFNLISADSEQILHKLDQGIVDIGCLVEPVDYGNYETLRLPSEDRWGIISADEGEMSDRSSITIEELSTRPLSLPQRDHLYSEVLNWFKDKDEINILAKHALLSNTIYLVKSGMLSAVTLEGAIGYKGIDGIKFIPIAPEIKTSSILAWKKNKLWSSATSYFLEEAQKYFSY